MMMTIILVFVCWDVDDGNGEFGDNGNNGNKFSVIYRCTAHRRLILLQRDCNRGRKQRLSDCVVAMWHSASIYISLDSLKQISNHGPESLRG